MTTFNVETQNLETTDPSIGSNVTRAPRRNRSSVWNHFTPDPVLIGIAICDYCKAKLKSSNGTTSMAAHTKGCKSNPNNGANKRLATTSSTMHVTSPSAIKFDQQKCRQAVVAMIVEMELSFKHVDHKAFRRCMNVFEPRWNPISRHTVARDVLSLWSRERTKLKSFLSQHCQSVCLTTDGWTSCQNKSYMCVTAHFIDNNWKLHKKILNFVHVFGHSGKVMANTVAKCLEDWGLSNVLSVTVDNASSNDRGIDILKKRLKLRNNLVLNGDHFHARCCAHVLNLVVKDGLKEIDASVVRIRDAVQYVTASASRELQFLDCAKAVQVEYKGSVILDVDTRWNSTHDMLKAALKLEKAFAELDATDSKYRKELERKKGVPTFLDWEKAHEISQFLEIFKASTLRISGSSYVTSNLYLGEVFSIGCAIRELCESDDPNLFHTQHVALNMREKYDKYWGGYEKLNMLLLISFVLDPRQKMVYANWFIEKNFVKLEADALKKKLDLSLKAIFKEYNNSVGGGVGGSEGEFEPTKSVRQIGNPSYYYGQFMQSTLQSTGVANSSGFKSELIKYFNDGLEKDSPNFDILNYWKVHSSRLPVLANIARDLLAIPVSTVASESAFSTGGRVLDEYRSRLSTNTVEALICTEDWLGGSPTPLPTQEDMEDLEKIERDVFSQNLSDGVNTCVNLDED